MTYDLIRCHLSLGYVGLYIVNKTNELRRICDYFSVCNVT